MLLLTCGDAEKAHAESSANDEQTKASASIAPFPQAQEHLACVARKRRSSMAAMLLLSWDGMAKRHKQKQ
jgi:hypothetical protein